MTKILIVEDDAAQARVLSRAIALRRPDYLVLTSPNGLEATRLLREEDVDLILTDLQMPEMNGLELLAWLLEHRPGVAVFTMTAYGNEQTIHQLSTYGPVACFTKPVDVETVVTRMAESLQRDVRGHVRNLSLPGFLQLIEIERVTCTLNVEHDGRRGTLFVHAGELLDARSEHLAGEAAAMAMLAWPNPSITISGNCAELTRSINKPLNFVIMDALRLQDENARGRYPSQQPFASFGKELEATAIVIPPNAAGIAIVDLTSGAILSHGHRAGVPLAELSSMALAILRLEEHTVATYDASEQVEELALTTPSYCELIRRLPGDAPAFVLMVYRPDECNMVMARLELDRVLSETPWGSEP